MPQNSHFVIVCCCPDNAIRQKHNMAHLKWRWKSSQCCGEHEKCNTSSEKDAKVLRVSHTTTSNTLWNICRYSRRATPATRNNSARRLKSPTATTFAALPIRRNHCERLPTVANMCELRLTNVCEDKSTVAQKHLHSPDHQSKTRTLRYAIRNGPIQWCENIKWIILYHYEPWLVLFKKCESWFIFRWLLVTSILQKIVPKPFISNTGSVKPNGYKGRRAAKWWKN